MVSLVIALIVVSVTAQKSYDPEASDGEIKIGNIAPYTGWEKEYAGIARAEAAYFQVVNDRGGINGRKKCGDNLTRANVMKQAANLDLELGMLRPGIRIKTTSTDDQSIKQLFLMRFDGKEWAPFGSTIDAN